MPQALGASGWSLGLPTDGSSRSQGADVVGSATGPVGVTGVFAFGTVDSNNTFHAERSGAAQPTAVMPGMPTGTWTTTISPPPGDWQVSPWIPPMNVMREGDHWAPVNDSSHTNPDATQPGAFGGFTFHHIVTP